MSTYTPAPVDGSLSLLQIFEFQATTNPHQPIFRYDSASARDGYENITWQQAVKMFDTTARILRRRIGNTVTMDCAHRPVIGILAATSSILYVSLVVGTIRAGCTVFPLSTRNSDAAIAHLIAESGMKHLLISQDSHMQDIARKANALLNARNIKIGILPIPTYEEISDTHRTDLDALPPLQAIPDERVLLIAHSSGEDNSRPLRLCSTLVQNVRIDLISKGCAPHPQIPPSPKGIAHSGFEWLGTINPRCRDVSLDVMGILAMMRAAYSGMVLALFAPTTNGVIPTPERVLQSALATKCKTMVCPPMFLEHWAKDPSSVEKLRSFSHVAFTGGPLAQQVGGYPAKQWCGFDVLLRNDRNWQHFTEVHKRKAGGELGIFPGLSYASPSLTELTTVVCQFVPGTDAVLVPIDGDSSRLLFQLIIKESATQSLALSNMEIDGVPACYMGALESPKYTHDQIMHSNGEKTNPGPIEYILAQNPLVQSAIMFGRAKPHGGVLVVPSDKKILDIQSFRDAIWPTIEQANNFAPSHSRLFKEMIIFFNPSKLFHTNSKGTPKRYAILRDHAQEIEDAYDAFDKTASSSVSFTGTVSRKDISINDALEIVRAHVHAHVNPNVTDNEDMFEAGADRQVVWYRLSHLCSKDYRSLLAARIRRGIIQSLSEPHLKVPDIVAQSLPNDIVFASPTIRSLASFIFGVIVCATSFPHMGDSTFVKNVPASILDQKDHTIVRLRESAAGESPLILIHGGAGFIYPFVYMQTHFHSGLWAIQVTDDTPRTSFVAQTDFYHQKIKESQPNGPYRLGGYSGGAIMACVIAKLLEANGDKVIQLALIDSSPFIPLTPRPGLDTSADFSDVQTLHDHHERSVRGLCNMFRGHTDAWWTKYAAAIWGRWTGRLRPEDMSELMERMYENLVGGMIRTFDFILDQALGDQKGYKDVLEGMVQWTKEIQAPITVYKATNGIIQNIPLDSREKWGAFGVDWAHEDVRVVEVDTNHLNIVAHDELVEDIQKF
ncbi:NRPS-like enzyme [Mycena sanguinolenta]|uniref:NRPS-like enzyme n=1 Tax=Mycena sanguinolenta TaxID=230812 RepID=A0A8H6XHT5_9AGAR|nr:NRPS-like enzyme [Mycena sanguinolenta]